MQDRNKSGGEHDSDPPQIQDYTAITPNSNLLPTQDKATEHETDLIDLPIALSYQNILKQLTPADFRALRRVSREYKLYMDRVYNYELCWQQWLKAEFPRAAIAPPSSAREAYFNCLRQNYDLPVYYPHQRFPEYKALQAFLCGGYDQFFLQMRKLPKKAQYQCLHAGFSMGFFLLRIAKQRGLDPVLEALNSTAWTATCEVINTSQYGSKKKVHKEALKKEIESKKKIESDFNTINKHPLISEGTNNDNYELIAMSLENLDIDQKLQFLIGIHGEFRHLLHILLHNSKIKLAKALIQHVESLCHLDPNYFPLLQPEGVVCLSAKLFQPLFSFIALGKNEEFLKCFSTLNFPEQCHILTHYRADGMTLIMLAAHNGNLAFLVLANQFVKKHSEECEDIMNINATFGEEPLIEAWNNGHVDCVDFLLETYPNLFSTHDNYRCVWQNVQPSAIANFDLSCKVLNRYIKNSNYTRLETALKPVIFKVLRKHHDDLIPNLIALCPLFDKAAPNVIMGPIVGWQDITREYLALLCTEGDEDSINWMWNSPLFQPANKIFCTDSFNPLCTIAFFPNPRSIAKMLIAQGCPITPTGEIRSSPLQSACRHMNQELLVVLLEEQGKGIDIGMNFKHENIAPLGTAISFRHIGDPRFRGCKSREQKFEFIRTLIAHGANVTDIDATNCPLIALCSEDEFTPEILLLLLKSYPDAATRHAHCHLRDNIEGKSVLLSLINYYTQKKHMDLPIEINKLFILLQYGTDPNLCLEKGNGNFFSRLLSHYPINISWPKEIKDAICFCCDFRAKVLAGATQFDLEKLQLQHPEGFIYLSQGILNDTLFIDPAQIQAIEHLKPLIQQILKVVRYSEHMASFSRQ